MSKTTLTQNANSSCLCVYKTTYIHRSITSVVLSSSFMTNQLIICARVCVCVSSSFFFSAFFPFLEACVCVVCPFFLKRPKNKIKERTPKNKTRTHTNKIIERGARTNKRTNKQTRHQNHCDDCRKEYDKE